MTELWNDDTNDFEERRLPAGTTSPFAIRFDDQRVAFQLRSGLIRPNSFTGALRALLNEGSEYERWRVRQEVRYVPWIEWVGSVDRVTQLRIRLERPNPHYQGRARVEAIIEGANARMAEVV